MQCRQCTKPVKKVGDYIPPTCGKSECQEAEYKANAERAKPKARRLKPKEGALKADGTRWTSQPGGIEKLEIPVPSLTSNEYVFARMLVELVGQVKFDYQLIKSVAEGLGVDMSEVGDALDRAEAVVYRVKNKRS